MRVRNSVEGISYRIVKARSFIAPLEILTVAAFTSTGKIVSRFSHDSKVKVVSLLKLVKETLDALAPFRKEECRRFNSHRLGHSRNHMGRLRDAQSTSIPARRGCLLGKLYDRASLKDEPRDPHTQLKDF